MGRIQKTVFIENIAAGTGANSEYFQVGAAERKTTKTGSAYLSLTVRDRTGEVSAKYWSVPADVAVSAGQYVQVEYTAETYKDQLQLKVTRLQVLDRAEVAIEDFIPASKRDRDEMFTELCAHIKSVSNEPLRDALCWICNECAPRLRDAPAAKKKHQAYLGGLLEHILRLCEGANDLVKRYPDLDRDVLIAAAIVHDIGKLRELVWEDRIDYSLEGSLVGHIIQGSVMWHGYSGCLDLVTRNHIAHIIASHHGQREWGAAQVPMTREAFMFHCLDMMDAQYEIRTNLLAAGVNADGLTPFDFTLGCSIWDGGEGK
jgi:3'-5' exoribonuclease